MVDFLKDTSERFVVIGMLRLVSPKRGGRPDVYVFQHRVANLFRVAFLHRATKSITLYKTYGVGGLSKCWLSKY
jgi:hypothetical protein